MTLSVKATLARQHFPLAVDVTLPSTGITAIVGASGSGKTSLLEVIAGLTPAGTAEVHFNEHLWQDANSHMPLAERRIGLVLQEPSLFPHLTVLENLRYGWQRAAQHYVSWDEVINNCGVADLLTQKPSQLSGGQQQRVAFARALLAQPQLLLLDEPFSALDEATRQQFVDYLRQVATRYQLPVLFVSHQLSDIAEVSDHLVLLQRGQVLSSGPLPQQLRQEPLRSLLGMSVVSTPLPGLNEPAQQRLRIYARDVSLSLQPVPHSSVRNQITCVIFAVHESHRAGERLVELECQQQHFFALVSDEAWQQLALRVGQSVVAHVKAAALHHSFIQPLRESISETR